ncbi:MAG: ATP-grasp domain-containing protein [Candidatus Obscuribacterales bacterium]|nr:ATP-grasp domain-containing protein [Candidatus Obscuribacterales bacterium]
MDKNCLTYWYPKLREAAIPAPRTLIHKTDCVLDHLLDGVEPPEFDKLIAGLEEFGSILGYPMFLRTGMTSGKHNWKNTCFIQGPEDFPEHIAALVEFSAMAGFFGLPHFVWVARSFLKLKTYGVLPGYSDMPLAREFRAFVSGGDIQCIHPYWPQRAVAEGEPEGEWIEQYREMCTMGADEQKIVEFVSKVAALFSDDGAWSVDVCQLETGQWLVTDMAIAQESFHWEGCEKAASLGAPPQPEAPAIDFDALIESSPVK